MKKIILLLFIGALSFNVSAQSNSLTAGIGVWPNAKVRVQYEAGFADMHSTGVNLAYYLENWAGPRGEAFYRIYFGGDNEKGMFMQASAGAGMFSFLLDDDDLTFDYYDPATGVTTEYDTYESGNIWTTLGGGIALGGKMTSRGGFVFETTMGFQLWSGPPSREYSTDYDDYYIEAAADVVETVGYYVVGPGFPIHIQMKFGFNF